MFGAEEFGEIFLARLCRSADTFEALWIGDFLKGLEVSHTFGLEQGASFGFIDSFIYSIGSSGLCGSLTCTTSQNLHTRKSDISDAS